MSIVVFVFTFLCIPSATLWYFQRVLYMSNNISKKPGPQFQNNCFNFMSWNLNSLAKNNIHRVSLIEAHNSFYNYDLISICETSLNDLVELPGTLLHEYTFVSANNPANTRRGGVGLFYKNSLPIVIRNNLSFDESIVVELKLGRKKYFLLFCIEVLPLTTTLLISKPSCQILGIYMQKSNLKILLLHFLQVTLMLTLSIGGLMVIQLQKARILNISCHH